MDLTGYILSKELGVDLVDVGEEYDPFKWTNIILPARYEKDHPWPFRTNVINQSTGSRCHSDSHHWSIIIHPT
jgi:hypothetical protein